MECRICLETGNFNTMIAPCRCAGTSKWVHRKCIERWIRECDNELAKKKCMECTHEYQYKVLGLLTLFKNFRKIKKTYLELSVIIVFLLFIVKTPSKLFFKIPFFISSNIFSKLSFLGLSDVK